MGRLCNTKTTVAPIQKATFYKNYLCLSTITLYITYIKTGTLEVVISGASIGRSVTLMFIGPCIIVIAEE